VPRKSTRSAKAPKPRTKNLRQAATRDDAKQQTRTAIVQAALELFAEQGLDVPSLDAICDRAGYTRGAFYVHFKTREDILVAVMDQIGAVFLGSVFEGINAAGPVRTKRLEHVMGRFADAVGAGAYPLMASAGKGPLIHPHQLLDACARSTVVRERYRDLVQMSVSAVANLVREDQADGDIRKDVDPQIVASMGLAVIIGAQTMGELGLPLDPAVLAAEIGKMLGKA
jgi:TetR/AcrR family transcriptional repressor of nem operon